MSYNIKPSISYLKDGRNNMKFKIIFFYPGCRQAILREYILHFLNLPKAEKFAKKRLEKDEGYAIEDVTPSILDY